jgi:L-histidine N-alpha-methyltransferase
MLRAAAAELAGRFPWLRVRALVGDYLAGLAHLPRPPGRRLYVFLGGTIGNFLPAQAVRFLAELAACMGTQDRLLLGADRLKERARLEAAYDDAAGITAAFNLNLLNVLNRELGADFDPEGFAHRAPFVAAAARIEMHLVAQRAQTVRVAALDRCYRFAAGEHLLTEISRKFSRRSLEALLARAGLAVDVHYEAEGGDYSLLLARRRSRQVTTL